MRELPPEFQYTKGSRIVPPLWNYGWIVDEEEALAWAERLGLTLYEQTGWEIDPELAARKAVIYDRVGMPKWWETIKAPEGVEEDQEVDSYHTILSLLRHQVRTLPPERRRRGCRLRAVKYKGEMRFCATLYDNLATWEPKYNEEEVDTLRNCLRFKDQPQWFPDWMNNRWRRR